MKNRAIEYSNENRLELEIMRLRRELTEGKFVQPPTTRLTTAHFTDLTLNHNENITIMATLVPGENQRLPTWPPEFGIFKSWGYNGADEYPIGANWSNSERINFTFEQFFTWGATNNVNVVAVAKLINKTGAPMSIRTVIRWRFMNVGAV